MKIGFLHLGDARHGVCRYGRMIAHAVAAELRTDILEVALASHAGTAELLAAAAALAHADVVHVQYNRSIWGDGWNQWRRVRAFVRGVRAPLVASLHDVYPSDPWDAWKTSRHTLRGRLKGVRRHFATRLPLNRTLRTLVRRAARTLVCFEQERQRLLHFAGSARVRVIGHFIEPVPLPDRAVARAALGVDDRVLLCVLGYIHPRKGHDVLLDALAQLDERHLCVFAGAPSPGTEAFLRKLQARAERLGIGARLRVTGFLPPHEQAQWLAATDLAVCPFRFLSASGSLATWIGAGRRILCHDVPQIAEYRRIAPHAIATFAPFDKDALAGAITREIDAGRGGEDTALAPLRARFALPEIAKEHLALYREVQHEAQQEARACNR